MEFAEAGLEDWPDALTSSPQYMDSSSFARLPTSSMRDQPAEHSQGRHHAKAEKKRRKEERAARRAQKEARRLRRESKKSGSVPTRQAEEGEVLVPSSNADRPTQFSLSTSPPPPLRYPPSAPADVRTNENDGVESEDEAGPSTPVPNGHRTLAPSATPTSKSKKNKKSSRSKVPLSLGDTTAVPSPQSKKNKGKRATEEAEAEAAVEVPASQSAPEPHGDQQKKDEVDKAKTKSKSNGRYQLEVEIPSSAPAQTKKRPRQSEDGNAVAGPSTSTLDDPAPTPGGAGSTNGQKKAKTKRQSDAKKPRTSRASGLGSLSPSKVAGSDPRPTPDELRDRLDNPEAINDFLAMRFWPPAYLNRLEQAGILTVKKGKLSDTELKAVRDHLDLFMRSNRLRDDQLVEVIMGKGKESARSEYPDFWRDIALEIPGRPLRYVVKMVQRMYDPRARKGAWTKSEDADLIRAHDIYPNQWTKIAAVVDRTEQDCRDRYNKEISNTEKRNTGVWSSEEEAQLLQVVKEANRKIGNDELSHEAPWEAVAAKMGYQRGPTQCRVKWHRVLLPRALGIKSPAPSRRSESPSKRSQYTPTRESKQKKQKKPKTVKPPPVKYPVKSQEFIDNSDDDDEAPARARARSEDDMDSEEEGEDEIEYDPTPSLPSTSNRPNGHTSELDEIEPDSSSQ